MDITNFSTFGSCSSRNIFNSRINKDYKKYFRINKSVEAQTLISLMSEPIEFNEEEINSPSKYDNQCVIDDLSKNFLNLVEQDFVDYIIMDTLFDVAANVIIYDENQYLTSTRRIANTDFYNSIEDYRKINIFDNFEEYYYCWTEACDNFFKFVYANCEHTKIILNCSRSAYKYRDSNGNVCKNTRFEKLSNKFNRFRNLLDKYILENFDVEVLKFDTETYTDQNHIFGVRPTHFEEDYYIKKNQQLPQIIKNNEIGFNNEKNVQYREECRKEIIQTFGIENIPVYDRQILNKKRNSIEKNIQKKLRKYNTARIDIKNKSFEPEKNSLNSVKIDNYTDFNLAYSYPSWFENEYGKGLLINSRMNFLKFDIIVKGDGQLHIYLRSPNNSVKKKKRPIYLRYTKFCINNKNIFKKPKLAHHDRPYVYKQNVKDGERLTVYLEWMPF